MWLRLPERHAVAAARLLYNVTLLMRLLPCVQAGWPCCILPRLCFSCCRCSVINVTKALKPVAEVLQPQNVLLHPPLQRCYNLKMSCYTPRCRGAECPYRHEMPTTGELANQNIKDRYYGINDPVANKMMRRVSRFRVFRTLGF